MILMNKKNTGLIGMLSLLLNLNVASSQDNIWQNVNLLAKSAGQVSSSHVFDANDQLLRTKLSRAPNEVRGISDIISLPMPDGSLAKFNIVESPSMEDGLADEFPQIKSYKVYGIDDPSASGRVDMSPNGFHGMLMTSQGRVFIDPINYAANASRYLSKFRTDSYSDSGQPFQCGVHSLPENDNKVSNFSRSAPLQKVSGSLTSYRIAVSATSEYVNAVGGTLDAAMAEINTAINRVNQIYESDLGIHLNLVSNNSLIIEHSGADFGFTNNSGSALISENQSKIDSTIGSQNYDIGHIFSTGGGGLARLGVVCTNGSKAGGVTGLTNPTGDTFYIDYVAHEIGHQFSANHTFNGSTSACGSGNRNALTAFEPGSGSTIMSYASICGNENITLNSDATFHAGSIAEMNSYVAGGGSSCATYGVITPANSDPSSVNAGADRTIPKNTPFRLTASAVDTGDTLSYQWDQMDAGTVATTSSTIGTDQGNNPLFRSYVPYTTNTRDFTALSTQLSGTTTMNARGETLPTTARTLNFRVTVRDGRTGQGTDDVAITVDSVSGPFAITSQAVTEVIIAPTVKSITWNIAGTTNAPVSCANVDIKLYTFSADKSSYGITNLLLSTPNDNAETVNIPDKANSQARFWVGCSDNIFYDLSDADLNITSTSGNSFPTTAFLTDPTKSSSTELVTATTTAIGGGGGGGALNILTLKFLFGLLLITLIAAAVRPLKAMRPLDEVNTVPE
jgi:hypothetical protein